MRELIITLNIITTVGIICYWFLIFTGTFRIKEVISGYRNWFMTFILPDLWIATTSILAAILLVQNHKKADIFGLLTGSSLIFLGLSALSYGFITKLIYKKTLENMVEIIIKLYCLISGAFLIFYFS